MTQTERPGARNWRPNGMCSFFLCDMVGFSDAARGDPTRILMRQTLYESLRQSFHEAGADLDTDCYHEDRGDGIMVIVPPSFRTDLLLTTVLDHLRTTIKRHNNAARDIAQICLRVAVHVGEADLDGHGIVSTSLTHAFRILDSTPLRDAVRPPDVTIALAVSQRVYDDVVRHDRGRVDHTTYYRADFQVKETTDTAWITVPGAHPPTSAVEPTTQTPTRSAPAALPPLDDASFNSLLFQTVECMLAIRQLRTERSRDQLVSALSIDIAGAISRSSEARADLYAILQTCLDYPGGLQQLLGAIHGLIGKSLAVQHLDQSIASLLLHAPEGGLT